MQLDSVPEPWRRVIRVYEIYMENLDFTNPPQTETYRWFRDNAYNMLQLVTHIAYQQSLSNIKPHVSLGTLIFHITGDRLEIYSEEGLFHIFVFGDNNYKKNELIYDLSNTINFILTYDSPC